ncbi:MAG: gamma-glutamylputrescine oxidase [Lentimonas sp.]|jgi:gamma-glutamylputrescine oxidase
MQILDLSYWEKKELFEGLDYVIIGAGLVGLSAAYQLAIKSKKCKILIVEKEILPTGASSKNAGFTCFGSPSELISDLQTTSADIVWSTVKKRYDGIDFLKNWLGIENIKYQQLGSQDLVLPSSKVSPEEIKDNLETINRGYKEATGIDQVVVEDYDSMKHNGFRGFTSSFFNKIEGQIDTASMYYSARREIQKMENVQLLSGIDILSFDTNSNGVELSSNLGEFSTQKLLIASNGFSKLLMPQQDVLPARAQVLVTEPIKDLKIKGTFHLDSGYYYFREIDQRILLGGGRNIDIKGETTTDFAITQNIQNKLDELLSNNILPDQKVKIEYRWAGIMGVGENKKPEIKKLNDRVSIAIRLGGMGVALGAALGKELADLNG